MALTSQTKSGIPLLTKDIGQSPRLDVGWPIESVALGIPVLEAKSPTPSAKKRVAKPSIKSASGRPAFTSSAATRELAKQIVQQQEADTLSNKDYENRLKHLIDGYTKFQLFAHIHPQNTLPARLQVNDYMVGPLSENDRADNGAGTWYGMDHGYGGRVKVIGDDEKGFFDALAAKLDLPPEEPGLSPRSQKQVRGVGIAVEYSGHPNVLWVTPEKQVWRYEPEIPAAALEQRNIDSALGGFFKVYLPSFTYNNHRLKDDECVVAVRDREHIHSNNPLCEDYALLYLMRRIRGMTHEQAAVDLIKEGDKKREDLLYTLGMEYREMSKKA